MNEERKLMEISKDIDRVAYVDLRKGVSKKVTL